MAIGIKHPALKIMSLVTSTPAFWTGNRSGPLPYVEQEGTEVRGQKAEEAKAEMLKLNILVHQR